MVNKYGMFNSLTLRKASRKKKRYDYSLNTWLKIAPETKVDPRAFNAVKKSYIMKHDEVFALYLSGKNQMRLFLMALKPYYEKSSKPVYVPYNEWINIRMTMS